MMKTQTLSATEQKKLLEALEARFQKHKERHKGLSWEKVAARLDASKLWSLNEMERTGGEPDVVGTDPKSGAFVFTDCSAESPKDRRSLCYDQAALDARKENKPVGSALGLAQKMGIELLTESEYRALQELGRFDLKTSSWIATPAAIRKLDGALFCDRRYDHVFVYHNGASSYYAARGFRGKLLV